jgi:ribonuclease D
MAVLTSPDTYRADPEHAWKRFRMRPRGTLRVCASRSRQAATSISTAISRALRIRIKVYEVLARELIATDRGAWLDEEMAVLTSPDTYPSPWRRR